MKTTASTSTLFLSFLFIFSLQIVNVNGIVWLAGNGTWSTASKWTGSIIPLNSNAEITAPGNYYVSVTEATDLQANLTLGGTLSYPNLVISTTFNIQGFINLAGGSITLLTGAILTVNGISINANSNTTIRIDYTGEVRTNSVDIMSGGLNLSGFGSLNISNSLSANDGVSIILGAPVRILNSTIVNTRSSLVMISSAFDVQNSITLTSNFYFSTGSTITVYNGGTVIFTAPVIVNPTALNTVIFSGKFTANQNVTIQSGSITLVNGGSVILLSGSNLIFNPSTLINTQDGSMIMTDANGGGITSTGNAEVYSNINTQGTFTLSADNAGFLSIIGIVTAQSGVVNVRGSVVIAGQIKVLATSSIATLAAAKLTFNPASVLYLNGSTVNQVNGAGTVLFLEGSSIEVHSTSSIANPVVIQCSIIVDSQSSITFAGLTTVSNGTSVRSSTGTSGSVIFKGTTDIANSGDVVDGTKMTVINANVMLAANSIAYFYGGVISLGSNASLIINGSFYTTFKSPVNIQGSGTGASAGKVTVLSAGSWWLQNSTASISAQLYVYGSLRLNAGGNLTINGDGMCSSTAILFINHGYIEVNGKFFLGNCKPNGMGTLAFNSLVSTNQVLPTGNYTITNMIISRNSHLSTESIGFNLKGNLIMRDTGSLLVYSNSVVSGNISLSNTATIGIFGVNPITSVRSNLLSMDTATNLYIEAKETVASQLLVTSNAKISGNLFVTILGSAVIEEIVVLNYGSYVGAFTQVNVNKENSTALMSYAMRYDPQRAVALRSNVVTSNIGITSSTPDITTSIIGGDDDDTTSQEPASNANKFELFSIFSVLLCFVILF